jgi:hypothetical protein
MMKTIFKDSAVGSFKADPRRDASLEFAVIKISGKDFLYFRVGKALAQKAGLKPKDRVSLAYDERTKLGLLKPHAKGWALQSGDANAENPPLVLRATYQDDWPYLSELSACKDVISRERVLEFKFPDATTFGKMEEALPDEPEEEEVMPEKRTRRTTKSQNGKILGIRDGKPYGRRCDD